MQNVQMQVVGDKLILEIDLTKRLGLSSTGKTTIVGTTGGSVKVPGHEKISFGLNVYTKVA